MLQALEKPGLSNGLNMVTENMQSNTRTRVRKGMIATKEFTINKGVTQECPLSPCLFIFFLEGVMIGALSECGLAVISK